MLRTVQIDCPPPYSSCTVRQITVMWISRFVYRRAFSISSAVDLRKLPIYSSLSPQVLEVVFISIRFSIFSYFLVLQKSVKDEIHDFNLKLAQLEENTSTDPTQLIHTIEALSELSGNSYSILEHLISVCNSPDLRTAISEVQPLVSTASTRLLQNKVVSSNDTLFLCDLDTLFCTENGSIQSFME